MKAVSRLEGGSRPQATYFRHEPRASVASRRRKVNGWWEGIAGRRHGCIDVGFHRHRHLLALYSSPERLRRVCEDGHKDLKDVSNSWHEPSQQPPDHPISHFILSSSSFPLMFSLKGRYIRVDRLDNTTVCFRFPLSLQVKPPIRRYASHSSTPKRTHGTLLPSTPLTISRLTLKRLEAR